MGGLRSSEPSLQGGLCRIEQRSPSVQWGQIEPEGLFMGMFVGGLCGWNLFVAYSSGLIGLRSGSVNRKRNPELFWLGTGVVAFVFGLIGVGGLLIGLGAPTLAAFAVGLATSISVVVVIALKRPVTQP